MRGPGPKKKARDGEGEVQQTSSGKWRGQVHDVTERAPNGKTKLRHTKSYINKNEAIAAQDALRTEVKAKKERVLHALAQEQDLTRDLPPCPDDAADADANTAYYGAAKFKEPGAKSKVLHPVRYVRRSSGLKGLTFTACCQFGIGASACTLQPWPNAFKETATFCTQHGGGKCRPHGNALAHCMECNRKGISKRVDHCKRCIAKTIHHKRKHSKGGCGMCPACEADVEAEQAAEAAAKVGKPPPPTVKKKHTKEHEIKMLQCLVMGGYVETFEKGLAPRPGEFTREHYFDFRCALARDFDYGETRLAYVDFVVHPKQGGKLVFIEIDENEHKFPNYTVLCDTTRMWNICESAKLNLSGDVNILWLRVNPNTAFCIGEIKHGYAKLDNTARCNAVVALLDTIVGAPTDPLMAVAYAFYQMRADCTAKVTEDDTYNTMVKEGVIPLKHLVKGGTVSLSWS